MLSSLRRLTLKALFFGCAFTSTAWPQTTAHRPSILLTIAKDAAPASLSSFDIEVKEDKQVAQSVSLVQSRDLPLHIGIVIDESGSGRGVGMLGVEIQRVLDSTTALLQSHRGDAFLVGFNDQIIISTELATDVPRLRIAADQLGPIGGSAIRDALLHAAQKFGSLNPESEQALRIMVLISDGHDNASNTSEQRAIEAAQREGVRIYAIRFPSREASTGEHLLEKVARSTGGRAFSPSNDSQLTAALADIGDDLVNSFLITFTPETRDGKFHSAKIRVRNLPEKALRFMPAFVSVQQ